VIHDQTTIIVLEVRDLLLEVTIAGQVHLEELIIIDKIEGNF
jgi:hypothetical protein